MGAGCSGFLDFPNFVGYEVDLAAGYFIDRNGGIFRRADAPTVKPLALAGSYDRIKKYEGAPEMMKPSGAILSLTDQYYVVTMKIEAANSFGAMVTDTYVSLFNLTDGKTYHDLENYASTWADDAWGQKKLDWMDVESEALLLGAMVSFSELSRESIDRIVSQIKG